MAWKRLAIGLVVGGKSEDSNSMGGSTDKKHADGLFSLFGHETWVYLGGILGFGDTVGPYGTAGLMIGGDPDIGVGAGIHFGKVFGLGVILPLRQTIMALSTQSDRISQAADQLNYYVGTATHAVAQVTGGALEQVVDNPVYAAAALTAIAIPASQGKLNDLPSKMSNIYQSAKTSIVEKLSGN